MNDLEDNKIYDDDQKLVEMGGSKLEVLAVDYDEHDEMKENANWVVKLNSPKLKVLCKGCCM